MQATTAVRRCAVCHAVYESAERFCPLDGGAILEDGADDAPLIGKTIGERYFVRKLIGKGGMGTVYEAEHLGLDKRVALKVLHDGADRDALARFRREARTASKIVHPNVVQILDVGTADGLDYLVMEQVAGRDLSAVLEDGPLPAPRAIEIADQILDGLEAIHGAGILHRDIKPANIVVLASGTVKIMDFGISRATTGEVSITNTNEVVGTPMYMAPEQISGQDVDHRADLYAVGVTLYTMLAGKPPFSAENFSQLAGMQMTQDAPTLDVAGVPAHVVTAVARALERSPARRFADAAAFRAALDGKLPATGPEALATTASLRGPIAEARPSGPLKHEPRTPEPVKRSRGPLVIGAVLVALLAAGTTVFLVGRGGNSAKTKTPADAPPPPSVDQFAAEQRAKGQAAENEGKLEAAIAAYEKANAVTPSPSLDVQIGGLYERLGKSESAIAAYERYLAALPNATDAARLRTRIAELRPPSPTPPASPPTATVVTTPATPAKPPKRPAATAKPAATCACLPDNRERFGRGYMCKTKVNIGCNCVVRPDVLCPAPWVKCAGTECAKLTGVVHYAFGADYQCAAEPEYQHYRIKGEQGEACKGYISKADGPVAADGRLECWFCKHDDLRYAGKTGDACTGTVQWTGDTIPGHLDCEAKWSSD